MRVKPSLLYLHATAILLARAVIFSILSSLPPDWLTRLLKGDKLRCANVSFVFTFIIQLYNVEVAMLIVSLTTPTKAEPLYKVHTHAGPAIMIGCPDLEVIL